MLKQRKQKFLLLLEGFFLSTASPFLDLPQKVEEKAATVLGGGVASEVSPANLEVEKKREVIEERCTAYWTTLAPSVEEFSSTAARMVAVGSGRLIKGILWCGDVTADRLKRGNEILKKRMTTGSKAHLITELPF